MAELVDAHDSKSCGVIHGSSILPPGTMKPKLLVIVGPTASGKSALAVKLARKLDGEIISADSRQVYRGLDLGTGKITKKEMRGVRHHLLDVADPKRRFDVHQYKKSAGKAVDDIVSRGKIPIICGGTGLYIDALVGTIELPPVGPDAKLRKRLSKMSLDELQAMLKRIDRRRWQVINANPSDRKNARRLIRAIEIASMAIAGGRHSSDAPLYSTKVASARHSRQPYKAYFIGIKIRPEELRKRIRARLLRRLKAGMIAEVRRLHAPTSVSRLHAPAAGKGLSWARMEELGLEYRYISRYLRGLISKEVMIERLNAATWQYARRQMTWFRRNGKIRWVSASNHAFPYQTTI